MICKEEGWLFSSVFVITERKGMGLYKVHLSLSLLGFGIVTMLAHFHMCGIMLERNASPRGLCVLGV